jgi:hypothetical protein
MLSDLKVAHVQKYSLSNGYAFTVTDVPSQIHDIIQDQYGYKFRNCFISEDKRDGRGTKKVDHLPRCLTVIIR